MKYVDKTRTVPEVFEHVAKLETNTEKVNLLKAYQTKALKFVINGIYNVDWSDMEIPEFTPNHRPPGICNLNINNSVTRIETALKFCKTKPEVTDKLLTIVLQEVSKDEAELLVNMFKGKKKIEGISKSVFKRAYPNFFPQEQE